jgi:hypothetical protein
MDSTSQPRILTSCVNDMAAAEHGDEFGPLAGGAMPGELSHRDHVRLGFELLRRYSFDEAAHHCSNALRGRYCPERLASDLARRTFILPDGAHGRRSL